MLYYADPDVGAMDNGGCDPREYAPDTEITRGFLHEKRHGLKQVTHGNLCKYYQENQRKTGAGNEPECFIKPVDHRFNLIGINPRHG